MREVHAEMSREGVREAFRGMYTSAQDEEPVECEPYDDSGDGGGDGGSSSDPGGGSGDTADSDDDDFVETYQSGSVEETEEDEDTGDDAYAEDYEYDEESDQGSYSGRDSQTGSYQTGQSGEYYATGSDHLPDRTPKTGLQDIPMWFIFCLVLFCAGMALIIISRKRQVEKESASLQKDYDWIFRVFPDYEKMRAEIPPSRWDQKKE